MALETQDIHLMRSYLGRGFGLGHFGLNLAGEIVDVVERMHGTISRSPMPLGHFDKDRARGISGFVYRMTRMSFDHLNNGFLEASAALQQDADTEEPNWLRFQAGLNGVFGDQLAAQNSPLAIRMQSIPATTDDPEGDGTRILFVHGLCMSEHAWESPTHQTFCSWARNQSNARIAYLRYNSGRHISENGRELSALLEAEHDIAPLKLIGHSMGGLLIRAALQAATEAGHQWPQRLVGAAFLGSPHQGAPLERLGNRANSLLKISPYVKPFSRLGNLRSAGIRDLRFGNLVDADWQNTQDPDHFDDPRQRLELPDGPAYLLLAATRSETLPEQVWRGKHDWLVPVASALGLSRTPGKQLDNKRLTRQVIPNINHLDLLSHERVYADMQHWIQHHV